jgi:hypothetical protein
MLLEFYDGNITLHNTNIRYNEGTFLALLYNCNTTVTNAQWSWNDYNTITSFIYGTALFTNSTVEGNTFGLSGITWTNMDSVLIQNCSFLNNAVKSQSAQSILVSSSSPVSILNSQFDGNVGIQGGAASMAYSSLTMSNCSFR